MKKEEILLKVRKSRKSYFLLYFLILVGIFCLFYLPSRGIEITPKNLIISIIVMLVVIKFIEIDRVRDWWAITPSSFIESKGILNKNVREVDFVSMSDISLDQPWYKRIWGYGVVNIRIFLNETVLKVKDINDPEVFIDILKDAMRADKKNEKRAL